MSQSIFFSVGEPSGDQHAARLIKALHHIDETLEFRGFGGSEMRASGCEIEVELTQHAVMGFLEVLPKIRQFLKFAKQAECVFKAGQVQGGKTRRVDSSLKKGTAPNADHSWLE